MTIDSEWVGIMKEECPTAFTSTCPFVPSAGYIDGMPLLMIAAGVGNWDDLVRKFSRTVAQQFRLGAKTVVLAFDVYEHVPMAKSITQANRAKVKGTVEFGCSEQLPQTIPEDYAKLISNRAFKSRVIELIVWKLPSLLYPSLESTQTLVIDYMQNPVELRYNTERKIYTQRTMEDIPPMGECDVKFLRWSRLYGDMVAYSVDGDFIPIALLEYEKLLAEACQQDTEVQLPSRVALYRIRYMPPVSASSKKKATAKRGQEEEKKKQARQMEYVNIQRLYVSLKQACIRRSACPIGTVAPPPHGHKYMHLLASLIGLTGTDFTRGLPLMGPRTIWEALSAPGLWNRLIRAFDFQQDRLVESDMTQKLVGGLYRHKFSKHATGDNLTAVLRSLHLSKLGQTTRDRVPTVERITTTVRNINWLLIYWKCNQPMLSSSSSSWDFTVCFPDPVCPEYGFKYTGAKRKVCWLDTDSPSDEVAIEKTRKRKV
jgi:hypothetical protein